MDLNATLIGEILTFLVFLWIVVRYIWPPIIQALAARQKNIADGLAAAEHGHHTLEIAKQRSVQLLSEAKNQAQQIVSDSQSHASRIIDEARYKSTKEAKQIAHQAQLEIERKYEEAKEYLRAEVNVLVVKGVEEMLHSDANQDTNDAMLARLIEGISI